MINSPEWFNFCNECTGVTYNNVNISAVSTTSAFISNTDGWDIYRSDQVTIENSFINNWDDCVSFKPSMSYPYHCKPIEIKFSSDSTNILVSNLQCNGSQCVFLANVTHILHNTVSFSVAYRLVPSARQLANMTSLRTLRLRTCDPGF